MILKGNSHRNRFLIYFVMALSINTTVFLPGAQAKNYHFDESSLGGISKDIDLSLLNAGLQQPGIYRMDIILNEQQIDTDDISLKLVKNNGHDQVIPCISKMQLLRWGVKVKDFPKLTSQPGSLSCVNLATIANAKAVANVAELKLNLEIPQAALRTEFNDLEPEELWDDGIAAFMLNYKAGASGPIKQRSKDDASRYWAQLEPGLNVGPWRVKSFYSWQGKGEWQRSYSYAERGIRKIKSRLTLGERSTPGEIFDSIPFTGAMLESDSNMLPASSREFTPVITGVARTNARIEISQNGYVLKTLSVSPGPFKIEDIPAGSSGSDLLVTVYEADGNNQVFVVAWQTPAIAMHEGALKYNLMVGRYRSANTVIPSSPIAQATAIYGLPYNLTLYGGMEKAPDYTGTSLGVGSTLGHLGAISVDGNLEQAKQLSARNKLAMAWRVRYSNRLLSTNTGISLSSTQYASADYQSLSEALDELVLIKRQVKSCAAQRRRQRSSNTLSLSQSLGSLGSLNLSGSRDEYWGSQRYEKSYGLNWSTSIKTASLMIDWRYRHLSNEKNDRSLNIWLSVPLGPNLNSSWSMSGRAQTLGINDHTEDEQLYWDIRENYHTDSTFQKSSTSDLHLDWNGNYGQVGLGYGHTADDENLSGDISGGVIIHKNGITLTKTILDTAALVSVPNVSGLSVGNWASVRTDKHGYTAIDGLTPYQENTIGIDPTELTNDLDIVQTDVKVVPTEGALVLANFKTRSGAKALVTIKQPDGSTMRFGSRVMVNGREGVAGMVDGEGLAYLTGLPIKGTLEVHSGKDVCSATYKLPEEKSLPGLYEFTTVCH